jgi:hypothetical protein
MENRSANAVLALSVIAEPLKEYWRGLKRFSHPEIVIWIKSLSPMSKDLINLALGSIVVSTIVSKIFGNNEGSLDLVDIPVLNEIFVIGIFLIGGLLSGSICHKPLRWIGGTGQFRDAVVAAIYVSLVITPIIFFLEGIYFYFTGEKLPASGMSGGSQAMYATLLAKIYEISLGKTLLAITGASIALILFVAGIALLFV